MAADRFQTGSTRSTKTVIKGFVSFQSKLANREGEMMLFQQRLGSAGVPDQEKEEGMTRLSFYPTLEISVYCR